jgi:hypothetical protein
MCQRTGGVGVVENSIKPPNFFHWIESTRVNLNLLEFTENMKN